MSARFLPVGRWPNPGVEAIVRPRRDKTQTLSPASGVPLTEQVEFIYIAIEYSKLEDAVTNMP